MKTSRRNFLAAFVGVTGGLLLGARQVLANVFVDVNDATAKALGYVEDVKKVDKKKFPQFKAGSNCENCALYVKVDGKKGGCTIFQNKWVPANGWCASWVAKP